MARTDRLRRREERLRAAERALKFPDYPMSYMQRRGVREFSLPKRVKNGEPGFLFF